MCILQLLFLASSFFPLALAWGSDYRGALYVLSQTSQQEILVSALFQNGTAQYVTAVPTGGKGSGARGLDPLQAADGLVVNGDYLFAVNPGSNELSIFSIDPNEPWSLTKVGNNTYSGGDYPTSIGVSPDLSSACVTNSGQINNVRCFSLGAGGAALLSEMDFPLQLGQSNPPVGPPKTPSDVSFSSNGQQLYVTVKGSGMETAAPAGRVEVFAVNGLNFTHLDTAYAGFGPGGLPFSITPIPDSTGLLLTDPAGGVDIISFDKEGAVSYNASIVMPGQMASCWSAYSAVADQYITADIATSTLRSLTIDPSSFEGSLLSAYNITTSSNEPGSPVDLRVAHFSDQQDFLYSLDSADQVVRIFSLTLGDTTKWDLVQAFELGAAYNQTGGAVGKSIEGMAVFLRPTKL